MTSDLLRYLENHCYYLQITTVILSSVSLVAFLLWLLKS